MRPDARTLWVGLAKFLAVIVGGTAVGAGIGIALSALSGNGGNESTASPRAIATPSAEARTPTPTSTARTPTPTSTARTPTPTSAARTPTPTGTAVPAGEGLGLRVESARLISASTASGRARQRARLVVRVRLSNRSDVRLPAQNPLLLNGAGTVRVDPFAADAAGPLLRPLAAGMSAVGELRYETAGELTQRLTDERRARLRFGSEVISVKLDISA